MAADVVTLCKITRHLFDFINSTMAGVTESPSSAMIDGNLIPWSDEWRSSQFISYDGRNYFAVE